MSKKMKNNNDRSTHDPAGSFAEVLAEDTRTEPPANQAPPPRTVSEALTCAGAESPELDVWGSARESAAACDFARPSEVLEALRALAECARAYFAASRGGESVGSFKNFFAERGFKYAPTESQTTMTMFGKDRTFTDAGRRRAMLKHLTLGGGDKRNCLQIYFEPDKDAGRFVIGHCGRHLRTAKFR